MNPNERSIEYSYTFNAITKYGPSSFLDVGTGKTSLPALVKACGIDVIAIDRDPQQTEDNPCTRGGYCSFNIVQEELINTTITQKFDMISCISVLEHNPLSHQVVEKMASMLNPKGVIVLTFPYNEEEYVPNAYKLPEAGYGRDEPPTNICQMYSREQVEMWEKAYNLEVVDQQFWKAFTGKYWTYGERMWPPTQTDKNNPHQLTCLTLQLKD